MTRTRLLLLALAALAAAPAARAEGLAFRFVKALTMDEKEVKLRSPEGVGCAEDGRVVVADTGNGRLVAYTLSGGVLSLGTEVKVPELKHPTRVALDGQGGTWVLDRKARKIARLKPGYGFAGWVEPKGVTGFLPVAFVVGAGGKVTALDAAGAAVLEVEADGTVSRRLPLPPGQFLDLWVDAQGTTYAVEAVAAQVFVAARADTQFKPLTRSLKDAMSFPTQVLGNGRGRLLLVDQHGMGVAVLGVDGSYQGRQLTLGWTNGLVAYPSQLCLTSRGEALLADRGNSRVQLFTTLE